MPEYADQPTQLDRTSYVCVVDDDAGIRESLRFLLEDADYQVEEAEDGGELIALLRASPRQRVVLLDRMMARVDGVETLRRLQDEPALIQHAVLIYMTARHDAMEPAAASLVRHMTYASITKPFDLDVLLDTVERASKYLAKRAVTE